MTYLCPECFSILTVNSRCLHRTAALKRQVASAQAAEKTLQLEVKKLKTTNKALTSVLKRLMFAPGYGVPYPHCFWCDAPGEYAHDGTESFELPPLHNPGCFAIKYLGEKMVKRPKK